VRLARRTLIFTVGLFLVLALNGCGGGSGGAAAPVASKTVEWQADGNGYVQFFTDDPKWYGYGLWNYNGQTYQAQMSSVTAVVEKKSGASTDGYGIIFCYQDNSNFYRLLIDTRGHYTVISKVSGTATVLVPWTTAHSAWLNSGVGVTNELTVAETSPGNFSISFNGTQEAQFSDNNFVGGKSGFYMSVAPSAYENFPAAPEDVRFKLISPVNYPAQSALAATLPGSVSSSGSDAALE
jgi:hypothetical protein